MSEQQETVRVALGTRSYAIEIGTGSLARIGSMVDRCARSSHAVIITDAHVEKVHAHAAAGDLAGAARAVDVLVVEPGETSKSIDVAAQLWQKLLDLGTDRASIVVAVGGGVIGDLAGFVAATFARGLRLVQVPTSLLAQVDSSVGGKVAVNLPGAKNMVGAFWQPSGVLIDTAVLSTLHEREYRAGLAEVVKYGVILDAEFFTYLERHVDDILDRREEVLRHLIARSCRLKAGVVEQDEREESGLRAVLNYGHTFCHALESVTGFGELLHGEGVAIGMQCASHLAERLGRVDAEFTRRQHDLLAAFGLPVAPPKADLDEMLAAMARDKKAEQGRLRFVLPTRIGHVEVVGGIESADVRAVLERT